MKKLANFLCKTTIAIILCYIILMLWKMAEVKLYGWCQESIVDTIAAATIALGVADLLVGGK